MKKRKNSKNPMSKDEKEVLIRMLMVAALTIVCLIGWYLKPKTVDDFKQLDHEYARGVITKANYPMGKSGKVHKYEFKAYALKYEGSVGYLKMNAEVGDSCTIIYDINDPDRNTIYAMDRDNELRKKLRSDSILIYNR